MAHTTSQPPTGPKQLLATSKKHTIAFYNPFLSQFQLHPHREGQALKSQGGGDCIKSESLTALC